MWYCGVHGDIMSSIKGSKVVGEIFQCVVGGDVTYAVGGVGMGMQDMVFDVICRFRFCLGASDHKISAPFI